MYHVAAPMRYEGAVLCLSDMHVSKQPYTCTVHDNDMMYTVYMYMLSYDVGVRVFQSQMSID